MSDVDSAQAILMQGHEHIIAGKVVSFEKFEHRNADVASAYSGASTHYAGSVGECSSDDWVVSGDFEYWATDDEWA